MTEILKCIVAFIILICIFYLWGEGANRLFKLERTLLSEKILWGFFSYFIVFQCLALIMIFSQKSFRLMSYLWLGIGGVVTIAIIIWIWKDYKIALFNVDKDTRDVCICLIAFLILACIYIMRQPYSGWDTTHYIGTMNEAIYTDRMYIMEPNDGTLSWAISIKYALQGGFFMQFAMISFLLGIKPIITSFYLMRGLGYFICMIILYLIGIKWFKGDIKKSLSLSCIYVFLNLCWNTYLSTDFFVLRLYEGKGYCQNVVIPAGLLALILIWKKESEKYGWKLLFLVGLCSVPLSMSSLLVFPAMVGIGCITMWTVNRKKWAYIYRGVICCVPNIIYYAFYFAANHGAFDLTVRW